MIRTALDWLQDEPRHRTGLRVLQVAIGAMLLFRFFTEVRFAGFLYGPQGLGRGSARSIFGDGLGRIIDSAFQSDIGAYLMLATLAGAATGLLLGYRTRLSTFVALVPFLMMERRLPQITDGGDNVTRLVLIYMLFALAHHETPRPKSLRVWFHNIAVAAIVAQVSILYFTSGVMKVTGEKWMSGTAMYYISQVDWFGHGHFHALFKHPVAATLGTVLPMAFLVYFPLAIFTRLKPVWISFGILFHLGIAVAMGLVTFALVMIGLELFLITDSEYRGMGRRLAATRQRFRRLRDPESFGARDLRAPKLELYIDGFCADCRAAGRWIAAMDLSGKIRLRSFRHEGTYAAFGITAAELERRMCAVDRTRDTVYCGFAAVEAVLGRLPVLWPLVPVAVLLRRWGLGDRAYDWLATRRRIIPDPRLCAGWSGCDPESRQTARKRGGA